MCTPDQSGIFQLSDQREWQGKAQSQVFSFQLLLSLRSDQSAHLWVGFKNRKITKCFEVAYNKYVFNKLTPTEVAL